MWEYRSEGGACVVFGAKTQAPGKGSKVLLLSKKKKKRTRKKDEESDANGALHSEIWSLNYEGFSPEFEPIERREWFTRQVVAPISRHTGAVSVGELVQVRPRDLVEVKARKGENKFCSESLPSDPQLVKGLLMDDALTPCQLWINGKVQKDAEAICLETISIEIKPKCGVLPSEKALLHPDTAAMKRKYSRYKLQQEDKMLHGKIQDISDYEPRDLFDKEGSSKQRALKALFKCPQNNLSIYKNCQKIFPIVGQCSLENLGHELGIGLSVEELSTAVTEALQQQQELLDLILSLQARDVYGIEAVHHLYSSVLGGETSLGDKQEVEIGTCEQTQEFLQRLEHFCNMPRKQALGVLQDYLIAATFKDCSLILTLCKSNEEKRILQKASERPNAGILTVHATDDFVYQIQLIDTDMKDASKIPLHYDLDKRILSSASSSWNQ